MDTFDKSKYHFTLYTAIVSNHGAKKRTESAGALATTMHNAIS